MIGILPSWKANTPGSRQSNTIKKNGETHLDDVFQTFHWKNGWNSEFPDPSKNVAKDLQGWCKKRLPSFWYISYLHYKKISIFIITARFCAHSEPTVLRDIFGLKAQALVVEVFTLDMVICCVTPEKLFMVYLPMFRLIPSKELTSYIPCTKRTTHPTNHSGRGVGFPLHKPYIQLTKVSTSIFGTNQLLYTTKNCVVWRVISKYGDYIRLLERTYIWV